MEKPIISKVHAPTLDKYIAKFGISITAPAMLEKRVDALYEYMRHAERKASCDICRGESDESLPECPWCGDGAGAGANAESEEEATMATAKKTSKKTSKKQATAAPQGNKGRPKPTKAELKQKKADAKAAKAAKPKKEKLEESKAAKPKKEKLARVDAITIVQTPSKELKEATDRVRSLQMKGVECMFELGNELFNIYEKKLYTQLTVDGKPVYTEFSSFMRKEIGFTPAYAFQLMDVAKNYSREQVMDIGVTKLHIMLKVPEERREELLTKAKDTPRSKLAEEVHALASGKVRDTGRNANFKGQRGDGRGSEKAKNKSQHKSVDERPKHERSERVTLVRSEPRSVVDLYKRGTNERAHDIEDAIGEEIVDNGVKIFYAITRDENGLSLTIEARREQD